METKTTRKLKYSFLTVCNCTKQPSSLLHRRARRCRYGIHKQRLIWTPPPGIRSPQHAGAGIRGLGQVRIHHEFLVGRRDGAGHHRGRAWRQGGRCGPHPPAVTHWGGRLSDDQGRGGQHRRGPGGVQGGVSHPGQPITAIDRSLLFFVPS